VLGDEDESSPSVDVLGVVLRLQVVGLGEESFPSVEGPVLEVPLGSLEMKLGAEEASSPSWLAAMGVPLAFCVVCQ
jgi:hypothetical protein